ncbi:MAG: ABC transporter ATP-binding protein [Ignisphaera sp.]|nr:ABC transporter ATP-binding protein [Ignisphaera sp.]MCX8167833.1 ABC transporter ATP-binding protein [Ignisphaera sp.]MDW8085802.1 ABC transporter ATP-binding protein [Ignisphaera sp.]
MVGEILSVRDLYLYYRVRAGLVKAVDGVSINLYNDESLAIIGESGSGKSSLARAFLRLLPKNVHRFEGSICINGEDVMRLSDEEFNSRVRWNKISMVPQASMNALNPVIKIGEQLAEPLIIHRNMSKSEAVDKAKEMLKFVGIPQEFTDRYPFELSGGMRQRVVIAMALITQPSIVILDEPTSALDVLTQANIMNLLKKIKTDRKISYIFITHDIALSSEISDKIAVMYAGQIVEYSYAEKFYREPQHPYSQLLLSSVPTLREERTVKFIPGEPPSLLNPPPGCRFHPRCPYAMDVCRREEPPIIHMERGSYVRCWLYAKG